MPKLIQISDTHLSPHQGFFYDNFVAVADAINAAAPDLVVSSGDLSVNGPEHEDDIAFARWCHERIEAPLYCLPGNHDVGEEPGGEHLYQMLDDRLLARYRRHFGLDWWHTELDDWRLIGLNSQLFNTGLPQEAEQWDWLEQALDFDGPIGVFQHKPLYIFGPGEDPQPKNAISPKAQDRLNGLYRNAGVRFIGSGHIHLHRMTEITDIAHIWCPSTAFQPSPPPPNFDPSLGYLEYTFEGTDFLVDFIKPEGLVQSSLKRLKENGRYQFLKDVPAQPVEVDWR